MEELKSQRRQTPFPQANDLNKIVSILRYEQHNLFSDDFLIQNLQISKRQIHYYISACVFLDYLDDKRLFTANGKKFKILGNEGSVLHLAQQIISSPVFGQVFFNQFLYGEEMKSDDIADLISINFGVVNESVAKRRSSTVKKWINWIFTKKTTN
jgi:hypothetical protein